MLDGRYRVEAILGTGGMGRVYKAEHTGIGRAVAIKVLHARLGGSKEAAQRFQREAMASGRLDHPNIVAVSDFGTLEDGSLFLVMEALEGEPLGSRLEREKRIPWQEALAIVRGVLLGLKHAHDKGVVHRDIKPDNIFLANKDGETVVKILDFGIAKLYAGNADDPATTRAGLTVGTPAYLSPEQAVGGAITPASDLYSTSIVLYEMLAGRAPFLDEDPLAMLTAHVSRDPPPFAEVAPDLQVPPGLEDVINLGLAKVSAERIGSALDYMQRLDEVTRAVGYDMALASARASSSIAIPAGPHSAPIASPGASFLMTPPPTAYGQRIGQPTPPVGVMTPMPFASEMGTAPTQSVESLPAAARQVSLHDIKEPLPQKYKVIAAAILLAAVGVAVFMMASGGGKGGADQPSKIVPGPVPAPVDRGTVIKAALHDLESGKTCADRKAAIPTLVEYGEGDDQVIAALKRSRYRMRGGVLGIGDSNTNQCLKQDAEMALQQLQGDD
ncbi:MAG TPA: serine/threonine-protein kinase [Kofleriaceae bacterium]|nr:serine/threonine-protein kinase [Kofleriaceae bacterium]